MLRTYFWISIYQPAFSSYWHKSLYLSASLYDGRINQHVFCFQYWKLSLDPRSIFWFPKQTHKREWIANKHFNQLWVENKILGKWTFNFWIYHPEKYAEITAQALKFFIRFPTTYLYERAFSLYVVTKTKYRYRQTKKWYENTDYFDRVRLWKALQR